MLKCVNKLCLFIFTMFAFFINVKAECSYKERKELLNLTKEVNIKFNAMTNEVTEMLENPNSGALEEVKLKRDYLQMNISGLKKGYFLVISNNVNDETITIDYEVAKNGIYTFDIENTSDIINYKIEYYSSYANCFADKITTKKIKKPKKNYLYNYAICSHAETENSKYCKKYISSEFTLTETEILSLLTDKVSDNKNIDNTETNKNLLDILKEFWYIPVSIILVLIVIILVIKIRKKRGEL